MNTNDTFFQMLEVTALSANEKDIPTNKRTKDNVSRKTPSEEELTLLQEQLLRREQKLNNREKELCDREKEIRKREEKQHYQDTIRRNADVKKREGDNDTVHELLYIFGTSVAFGVVIGMVRNFWSRK